jgi:hypothetical protein
MSVALRRLSSGLRCACVCQMFEKVNVRNVRKVGTCIFKIPTHIKICIFATCVELQNKRTTKILVTIVRMIVFI